MIKLTLRLGVIGTGAIGQDHIHRITNYLTCAKVTAVSDIDKDRAKKVIEEEKIDAEVYENGHELIHSNSVDAIVVTSWGETHEEFVIASIKADKPVFCEKPLATTSAACLRIIDAEIARGKKLVQVGFMRRFDTYYNELKHVLDDGVVGHPLMIHSAHRAPSAPGFEGDMAITDAFVHEIDIFRWLLEDEYISAQVILPRNTNHADEGLQDPHIMLLETKKGIRIDTEIFVNCKYGYDIQCQVVGETGVVNLAEPPSVLMRSDAKLSNNILTDWKDRFRDAYDIELQKWINAAKKHDIDGPNAWDGYIVSITADACVKAKHSKEIVPIELPEKPSLYDKD